MQKNLIIKAVKATKKPSSKQIYPANVEVIVESIRDKKGENIVTLDLRNIQDAVTDFFIITDAESTTQVKAIAENIIRHVHEQLLEKPWHQEGFTNAEWILIDYVNVVIHVFLKPVRHFYQLEELWSDATVEEHND